MTWFGKILTFVVMVAAVVAMYFMAQGFVTRTAWQTRADDATARLKQSEDLRRQDERRHQAEVDALRRELTIANKGKTELTETAKALATAFDTVRFNFEKLQSDYARSDVTATQQATNLAATVAELQTLQKRATDLENASVASAQAVEFAKREETKAKNAAKIAQALADDNARKVEELTDRVNQLRAQGGGGPPSALSVLNRPPPPLLANTRGEVTHVDGDLLVVSIGIDSGLAVNTVLEVSRADGTYLGTARVTDSLGLEPKRAVVTFTPARNVPLDRLPAAALPRKGDLVRPAAR
ncbi:MAG: hypothetical protein C0501_17240 [Isosphaera sp.]|nr:hypothetical protein [Isosphaera sp.]